MTALPADAKTPAAAPNCDSHVHLFMPNLFPYDAQRPYTPGTATTGELRAMLAAHGMGRVILVQPSVYGADNRCLLAGLEALGPTARGVAVIPPEASDESLADLWSSGVRAVRVNLEAAGAAAPEAQSSFRQTLARIAGTPLAIQVYCNLIQVMAARPLFEKLDRPLILDHYAGVKAGMAADAAPFTEFLAFLREREIWVKLSAPRRSGFEGPGFDELRPFAQAMIKAAPDRMVWASDWPHTGGGAARAARNPGAVEPFAAVDLGVDLARLRAWSGSEQTFNDILSTNPARLFGF